MNQTGSLDALEKAERNRADVDKRLKQSLAAASEVGRGVAEAQAARYGTAVANIMRRSNDNPEVIKVLLDLLAQLEHTAALGTKTMPLNPGQISMFVEAMKSATTAITPAVYSGAIKPQNPIQETSTILAKLK